MKPISLTVSGLHSFRNPQVIDFTQLIDTGIFGIFGPTGSGKSTILDAMTLALYGEVERSESNRVGLVNQQEEKIHVKFSFALYSGDSYETYTVERVYSRNKEQRVRSTLARLVHIEDGVPIPIADKETDVTRMIQELLGLEFKDFKRAVLLPQGKFAEFLTLKAQERRPMLERIFHLDEYGKQLKDRANQYENELKSKIKEIEIKQEMLSNATEKNLIDLESEISEIQQTIQKETREYEKFLVNFEQMQQTWNVQKELKRLQEELKLLTRKEEEIQQLEEKRKNGEKASFIEPTLKHFESLEKQLKDYEESIQKKLLKLEDAKQTEENYKIEWEKEQKIFEQENNNSQQKRYQLNEALHWETEILELRERIEKLQSDRTEKVKIKIELETQTREYQANQSELISKIEQIKTELKGIQVTSDRRRNIENAWTIRAKIQSLNEELKRRTEELKELEKNIAQIKQEIDKNVDSKNELDKDISELEKAIKKHGYEMPTTESDWNAQDKLLLHMELLTKQLQTYSVNMNNIEVEQIKLKEEKTEIEKLQIENNREIQHLEEQLVVQENIKKECLKVELEHYAIILAQKLEDGTPCIVCGATQHPAPNRYEIQSEISLSKREEIFERLELITQDLQQKRENRVLLEHQVNQHKQQILSIQEEKDKQTIQYTELVTQLPNSYQEIELHTLVVQLKQDQQLHIQTKELLQNWKIKQQEFDEKKQFFLKKYDQLQNQSDLFSGKLEMFQNQANTLLQFIRPLEEENKSVQHEWNLNEFDFSIYELDNLRNQIEEFDLQRETYEKELKDLEARLQVVALEVGNGMEKLNQVQFQIEQTQQMIELQESRLKEVNDKLIMLTEGESVTSILVKMEQKLQVLNDQIDLKKRKWEQVNQSLKEIDMQLNSDQAVYSTIRSQYEQTNHDIISFLQKNQWETIDQLKSFILSDTEIIKINDDIQNYERIKHVLIEQERHAVQKLNGTELTEEKWNVAIEDKKIREDMLNTFKQEISKKEFELQKIKQDYETWNDFEKKRKGIQGQLDISSELNQVLRGNSFIDFIAQEYLQNITIIASEKLLQLTRNRYRLEVDDEGMFQIVDEFNGNMSRPVRSLSGGETFLTSLALALALSSQIQLKGGVPLEFFFLDEGFGTLDSDLLDTAMMTLERLHAEHMVIGIISHVPELKNRLHRKIIVHPADDRGNGSTIQLEI